MKAFIELPLAVVEAGPVANTWLLRKVLARPGAEVLCWQLAVDAHEQNHTLACFHAERQIDRAFARALVDG